MLRLRREISDYSRSCEHLISAAAASDAVPFTQDEIDWIEYYATEMTNLVDQLVRKSKTQVYHDRQTIQAFAIASEALFLTDSLSNGERDSIRQSVSDITTQILDENKDPALEA
ncbi:MAG: hypothetical protein OJF51_000130 [Nitrospira sp.]|jgi:hypothetical protein|nr:MAG: hypothetical protein OJF51_000130 [Nitrospira sp.]